MKVVSLSDIGLVRSENQDKVIVKEFDGKVLAIVCDGMGGENSGEEASRVTAEAIAENFFSKYHSALTRQNIKNLLISSISLANSIVYATAQSDPEKYGMGTTCIVAVAEKDFAQIINIGDSRAYLLDEQGITRVTKDHTYVQMLVDRGEISEAEMKSHPQRNILIKAVGTSESVKADYYQIIPSGSYKLVLCSDGLYGYCEESDILETFNAYAMEEATHKLIEIAKQKGGGDNITIAAISDY